VFDDIFEYEDSWDTLNGVMFINVKLKKEIGSFAEGTVFDSIGFNTGEGTLSFFANENDEHPIAMFRVHITLLQMPVTVKEGQDTKTT